MLLTPNSFDNPTRDMRRQDSAFLSKYAAALDIFLRIGDVAIVALSAVLCYALYFKSRQMDGLYLHMVLSSVLLVLLIFPACRVYHSWRGQGILAEVVQLSIAWGSVMAAVILTEWLVKNSSNYSRLWVLFWGGSSFLLFVASRLVVRKLLGWVRTQGVDKRKVILVGATATGLRVLNATQSHLWMGMEVIGYIATPYDQIVYEGVPCLGLDTEFDGVIEEFAPDQVWIALPLRAEEHIQKLMEKTADLSIQMRFLPDFFGYELVNHNGITLAGIPVITLRGSRIDGHARVVKAVEDRLIGALLLIAALPLMLLIAAGVKLTSRGPVFYKQKRVGLDGKQFSMLKFRSMPVDVEQSGVQWGRADEKAVSSFGRFIRKTSLDELPQLLNVLKGDLSLVGPRPERPIFVEKFRKEIPGYMHKHFVKGGITGLAQINGWRGDSDLLKRIECDLQYIQNWSLWLDLKILLATPFSLVKHRNAC